MDGCFDFWNQINERITDVTDLEIIFKKSRNDFEVPRVDFKCYE